jgi:antirestriction protein
MEAFGYTFQEAMERQQRGCYIFFSGQTLENVAYELADEMLVCSGCKNVPDIFTRYFDCEAFARDLRFDGYTETKYGVILDN